VTGAKILKASGSRLKNRSSSLAFAACWRLGGLAGENQFPAKAQRRKEEEATLLRWRVIFFAFYAEESKSS
jgi:hypothetical protein